MFKRIITQKSNMTTFCATKYFDFLQKHCIMKIKDMNLTLKYTKNRDFNFEQLRAPYY